MNHPTPPPATQAGPRIPARIVTPPRFRDPALEVDYLSRKTGLLLVELERLAKLADDAAHAHRDYPQYQGVYVGEARGYRDAAATVARYLPNTPPAPLAPADDGFPF